MHNKLITNVEEWIEKHMKIVKINIYLKDDYQQKLSTKYL
jgi:hypothetical protein